MIEQSNVLCCEILAHCNLVKEKILNSRLYEWFFKLYVPNLIFVGVCIGTIFRHKKDSSLFFFFPFYHVGGAEKVHADIVRCMAHYNPVMVILQESKNKKFLPLFEGNADIFDNWHLRLWGKIYYHILVFVYLGYFVALINRQKTPTVFSSNSIYYYYMLPYLKKHVRCMDLTHAYGGGIEEKNWPYIKYLDARVVINKRTYLDMENNYRKHKIDPRYLQRIHIIPNALQLPPRISQKDHHERLKILYVGRGDEEKRVYLIGRIAKLCSERTIPADFVLIGDTINAIEEENRIYCQFTGEISDFNVLSQYYQEADIVIITSRYEGFPVTLMEGMAFGAVPLSTNVGGISEHITHTVNGFLIPNSSENEVITMMADSIQSFQMNRNLLVTMSRNAQDYAYSLFNMKRFCKDYRELFL
jgi:glycosyltransferase involved in cell wall biosynthesis